MVQAPLQFLYTWKKIVIREIEGLLDFAFQIHEINNSSQYDTAIF
jgi:hypothetical protein